MELSPEIFMYIIWSARFDIFNKLFVTRSVLVNANSVIWINIDRNGKKKIIQYSSVMFKYGFEFGGKIEGICVSKNLYKRIFLGVLCINGDRCCRFDRNFVQNNVVFYIKSSRKVISECIMMSGISIGFDKVTQLCI